MLDSGISAMIGKDESVFISSQLKINSVIPGSAFYQLPKATQVSLCFLRRLVATFFELVTLSCDQTQAQKFNLVHQILMMNSGNKIRRTGAGEPRNRTCVLRVTL